MLQPSCQCASATRRVMNIRGASACLSACLRACVPATLTTSLRGCKRPSSAGSGLSGGGRRGQKCLYLHSRRLVCRKSSRFASRVCRCSRSRILCAPVMCATGTLACGGCKPSIVTNAMRLRVPSGCEQVWRVCGYGISVPRKGELRYSS